MERNWSKPLVALGGVVTLLLLAGCGGAQGDDPPPVRESQRAGGQKEFGTDDRTVTVKPGRRFALTVRANPSNGEEWYLTAPHPDAGVLDYRGESSESKGKYKIPGSSTGTHSFEFTARGRGSVTVRLLYCPASEVECGRSPEGRARPTKPADGAAPAPSGSAAQRPAAPSSSPSGGPSSYPTIDGMPEGNSGAYVVWRITVR